MSRTKEVIQNHEVISRIVAAVTKVKMRKDRQHLVLGRAGVDTRLIVDEIVILTNVTLPAILCQVLHKVAVLFCQVDTCMIGVRNEIVGEPTNSLTCHIWNEEVGH